MMLKLTRPLAVFDLETTGTDTKSDRITQFAGIRFHANGSIEKKLNIYVNPGMRIPSEVEELTGITNAFIADKPPFHTVAKEIIEFLTGADIGGFAVDKFDLPLLLAEFARCGQGINLAGVLVVDAQKIYHAKEERRLENALQLFCGRKFEDGQWHQAHHDAEATADIIFALPDHYSIKGASEIPNLATLEELIALGADTSGRFCDADRKFMWRDGEPAFTFGKHKGRALRDVAVNDSGYLNWIVNKAEDFEGEALRIVRDAMAGRFMKRPTPVAS